MSIDTRKNFHYENIRKLQELKDMKEFAEDKREQWIKAYRKYKKQSKEVMELMNQHNITWCKYDSKTNIVMRKGYDKNLLTNSNEFKEEHPNLFKKYVRQIKVKDQLVFSSNRRVKKDT